MKWEQKGSIYAVDDDSEFACSHFHNDNTLLKSL